VHPGLGLGQPGEDGQGARPHGLVESCSSEQVTDRPPAPVVGLVFGADLDVQGADAVALDARDVELDREAERPGDAAQRALVGAGVEERREVPAPNPSSMPTTESPAAHEQSMAFSAVRPPSAAP
jgi:hypothetical protein